MEATKTKFKRKERKYVLTYTQHAELLKTLTTKIETDEYGEHTISSLYFDTDDFQFTRDNVRRPSYKEKFRIRKYGQLMDDQPCFLEIKRKFNGITDKRRVKVPTSQLTQYLDDIIIEDTSSFHDEEEHIHSEIQWMFRRLELSPKVLLIHERTAYHGIEDQEFRITFDSNIRYRLDNLDINSPSYEGQLVDPEIDIIMEVKSLELLPSWFAKLLVDMKLEESPFSKYKQVYYRHIHTEEPINVN